MALVACLRMRVPQGTQTFKLKLITGTSPPHNGGIPITVTLFTVVLPWGTPLISL